MATGRVTQFWTAIVSFLRGLLALVRPAVPAAGRYRGTAAPAARTAPAGVAALPPQRPAPVPATGAARWTGHGTGRATGYGAGPGRAPRARALPPTIKQRISAEAHGASPAVRRLPATGAPAGDRPVTAEHTGAAAPVGAAA
ncbi:DUF6344 domain-containing protein [Streptomyces somaliensis]|uniref:DUF6344 domain-containing protein n=1 Tax=Streptomyces somaliensis TaxID=78355 RepID=UPI0026E59760|nr:DUF6344 domain-containing protein [Streptomyces somaliensis]MCP9974094.1 DUF6344 domain-containing protein [Streptomyces somaliensis]